MTESRLGSRIREIRVRDRTCLSCGSPLRYIGEDYGTARFKYQCVDCGITYHLTYTQVLGVTTDNTEVRIDHPVLPKIIQPSKGEHR